jgi:hypothetical protein
VAVVEDFICTLPSGQTPNDLCARYGHRLQFECYVIIIGYLYKGFNAINVFGELVQDTRRLADDRTSGVTWPLPRPNLHSWGDFHLF